MSFTKKHRPAEVMLMEFGINSPDQIDLEAIAHCKGARVKYENLSGCEARLVGHGNKAIITISQDSIQRRKRFSLGHELGHWDLHKGRSFECRISDEGEPVINKNTEEQQADSYAADLLMPTFLFYPELVKIRKHSFDSILMLANLFNTSVIATTIRFIDANVVPCIMVCHGQSGRKWFKKSQEIPSRWFPKDQLEADSFAMDVLYGKKVQQRPQKIGAESWFGGSDAYNYEIIEHSIRSGDYVYTLLILDSEEMLNETAYRKKY